ncbi:helix-turn-helix domain-containing protein [Hymenobacter tibetensis]|uniref:Helix-turn-helix domain-containing protein n=1 Tax=Hymenobacter tibetensis TaxID=497967 RepID=A0ABY4CXV9_9BACT|nr:helix-turn-helix domain-containing protein [Hymenobacter tibetensis]UOG74998.1 helix-turn-helix domain-containing protein [Hymenobacter tibetensis]
MPHQGQILQEAIKNSGISITRIVDELGITRPTIYRKFKDETLDYAFVTRIGSIIGHNFSDDFTTLQQTALPFVTQQVPVTPVQGVTQKQVSLQQPEPDCVKQLMALQTKHIALLEAYNELLLKVYGPR